RGRALRVDEKRAKRGFGLLRQRMAARVGRGGHGGRIGGSGWSPGNGERECQRGGGGENERAFHGDLLGRKDGVDQRSFPVPSCRGSSHDFRHGSLATPAP